MKNKDDILDGIVDMVVGQIEIPSSDQNWKAAIRSSAISAHAVLSRHPWACSLMLSRESPSRLLYTEGLLAALRKGGFSAMMTHHAYHALDSHITGFTLWRVSFRFDAKDLKELATTFLDRVLVDEYPYTVEHVHQHLKTSGKQEKSEFEVGLDLILDGLERLMVAEKS